jgi:hypothetical protein
MEIELNKSEPQGLILLLIRPSISKIFESPPDNALLDADGIITSLGPYYAREINKHSLERIPTLCVSESGHVGYAIPMRLDLRLWLYQLTTASKSHIDYPLGLFTKRDVIMVADGSYTVMLTYNNDVDAMRHIIDKHNEFPASKIVHASTTIDEWSINNLRRLEATAETLLNHGAPGETTLPRLPPEIVGDWLHDFLEPIFNHVKEKMKETNR